MFRHLSLSCLLLAMFVPANAIAAPKGVKAGYIREVVPDAFKMANVCAADDDAGWNPVVNGLPFRELDCFRTNDGGSVELQLKGENSFLTIAENSRVQINDLIEKDSSGNFVIKPDIKKGYMGFRVEKNIGNKVDFSTGTAAASIRGTEGFIGGSDNAFFAGLKNGNFKVVPNKGDSLFIGAGETVIGKGEFVVLKLKSSGEMGFAKILNELIADSTLSLDDIKAAATKADEAFQNLQTTEKKSKETTPLKVPQVKYSSYDSLRCVANVSVSDVQKDSETRLSALMDGTPISEVGVKLNTSKRIALRSGVHEYEFVVENASGRNSVKKTLGCYPMKPFSVKIFGNKHEYLPIPPPPPGFDNVITQTLQFQIRVPEYDPNFLNRVTVRQNGKVILQERLSQIQNLDYQIPVELKRGHKNRFDIEVIHKSGYAVKATKVYEVSK